MTSAIEARADGWQRDYARQLATVAALLADKRALTAEVTALREACTCGAREAHRG